MNNDPDDTSSNPDADGHLPVSGEYDENNNPSSGDPLTDGHYEDDELGEANNEEGDTLATGDEDPIEDDEDDEIVAESEDTEDDELK